MNKINLPELNIQFYYLKVFHILHPEDVNGKNFTTVIAPDSYAALSVFTALRPDVSSTGVVLVDECISIYPHIIDF